MTAINKNRFIKLTEELKSKYKTADPFELCRCLGFLVIRTDLPKSVRGFFMETADGVSVVISNTLPSPVDRACAAHELGHALLHRGINTFFLSENTNLVGGRYEREADLFAAALLLDEEALSLGNVCDIAKLTGIPEYAVGIMCDYIKAKPDAD